MPKTKAKTKAKTKRKRVKKKNTAADDVVKIIKALKDKPIKGSSSLQGTTTSSLQGTILNNSAPFTGSRGGYSNPYMVKSAEQKDSDINRVPYQYQPAVRQQAKDDIKQLLIGYEPEIKKLNKKAESKKAEQDRLLESKKGFDIAGRVAYDPRDMKVVQNPVGNISYELKGPNDRETKMLNPLVFNLEPPRRRSVPDLEFSKEDMETIRNDKRFSKHSGVEDITPIKPLTSKDVLNVLKSEHKEESQLQKESSVNLPITTGTMKLREFPLQPVYRMSDLSKFNF